MGCTAVFISSKLSFYYMYSLRESVYLCLWCVCTTLHVSEHNLGRVFRLKEATTFTSFTILAALFIFMLIVCVHIVYWCVHIHVHTGTSGQCLPLLFSALPFSSTEPVFTDSQNSWARICLCPYSKFPPLGSHISSRAQLLMLGIQIQAL